MAINTESSSEFRYGIALQTAFGTEVADAGAFTELKCDPFTPQEGLNVDKDPMVAGVRHQIDDEIDVSVDYAMPTMQIKMKNCRDNIDLFLALFFQMVTEGATTPFYKEFTLPVLGETMQPDFSSDEGFFATIVKRGPRASTSWKVRDIIAQQIKLSCEPSGRISMQADLIGRGPIIYNANPSGTWTRDTGPGWRYGMIARRTVNFGSGAVSPIIKGGWELTLTQRVDPMSPGDDGSGIGTFETFALLERAGTFLLRVNKDSVSEAGLTNLPIGTPVDVNLGWGNATPGTDNRDLDIAFHAKLIEPINMEDEGVQAIEFKGELSGLNTATTPITIGVANAVDRAW